MCYRRILGKNVLPISSNVSTPINTDRDQFVVLTIELRKESFPKFMIPIHLVEKFGGQNLVTNIEVRQMTRRSCKSNKLRKNVNTIPKKGHEEHHHPKTGN